MNLDLGLITAVSIPSIIGIVLLQGYFLYLSWKQSRVKNITEEQLRVQSDISCKLDNILKVLKEKK